MKRLKQIIISCIIGLAIIQTPFANTSFAHDGEHITVQPGDTLSQIAKRYNIDTESLRRINNLNSQDHIWVGQQLALPTYGTSATSARTRGAALSNGSTTRGWITYTVRPGDSLTKLAAAYGVNFAELAHANGLSIHQRLIIGQKIQVPFGSTKSTAVAGSSIHIVQPGEHLGTIARHYNTTIAALAHLNNIANPSHIWTGQRLVLPLDAASDLPSTSFPTQTEKWIDVNLSQQRVVAYNGTRPVKSFIISSGLPDTPTVTGTFRIWAKTPLQDMFSGNRASGYAYYLNDVPWVQYFHQDYAFHGTYWHNNFGQPMSRGCINMRSTDAKWLYEWATPSTSGKGWFETSASNPGTLVKVHY
ncbi:LysM peptidoglycan-binding domain-containing protein [Chloroflexi bacterium TSY]|nr:LysM peptidoglycan-binding domain-containing protein [Chloroflexi bacterium TSY]